MKHLFIPYELAVIAKEKGFNEQCLGYYTNRKDLLIYGGDFLSDTYCVNAIAPIYQQIVDWFRNEHKIAILIEIGSIDFSYILFDLKKEKRLTRLETINYNEDYYKALNKSIEEAFKLI